MTDIISLHRRVVLHAWACAGALAIGSAVVLLLPKTAYAIYHPLYSPSQTAQTAAAQVAAVVEMTSELEFKPATATMKVGDTVEWRNVSLVEHTVTADQARAAIAENVALPAGVKPFHAAVSGGATFRYTFEKPGVYKYVCLPHEGVGMIAMVTVEKARSGNGQYDY